MERLPRPHQLYVKCEVFETPELMERILFMLSSRGFFHARQVCVHWRNIIAVARRLACPLYYIDEPTNRPCQQVVVMHYRNSGMKVTEGETLGQPSRPFLLIELAWRPNTTSPRVKALHRWSSGRSDFLRSLHISHPPPNYLTVDQIRPRSGAFARLICECRSDVHSRHSIVFKSALLGNTIDAADREGFRCNFCRHFCDVIVEASYC